MIYSFEHDLPDADKWDILEMVLTSLLRQTDWTQNTEHIAPLDKLSWFHYRKAIVTAQSQLRIGSPDTFNIPEFTPHTPTGDEPDYLDSIQTTKTQYQTTLDTLTQIENAVSPTNAQIVAAVKLLAKTQRLILKLLARMI